MAAEGPKPKEKKGAKKDAKAKAPEAPPAAALVQGMPPATFRGKTKCLHTYTSPRKVEDFGLD